MRLQRGFCTSVGRCGGVRGDQPRPGGSSEAHPRRLLSPPPAEGHPHPRGRIRAVGPRPCSPAELSGGKTGVGHPCYSCLFQPRAVCPSFGDSELDRNLGFNKNSASGQHSSFESASSAGLLALPLGYSSVPPGRLWAVPDLNALNALPRGGSFTATCCVGLWAPYPPEPG